MEKTYNKLVRDKIPEIIKNNNENPITRILTEAEYKKELEKRRVNAVMNYYNIDKKLFEEYQEVLDSSGKDRVEELADMLEIISYLAKLENVTLNDVIEIANYKKEKRGGFDKKIFLEKVTNINYKKLDN